MKLLTGLFLIMAFCARAQINEAKLANEYYQQGDLEKANSLYEDLSDNREAIALIYSNYLDLLIKKKDYKSAESLIKQSLKFYPSNTQYEVGLLKLYYLSNQKSEYEKYLTKLDKVYGENSFALSGLAKQMANQQLEETAIQFYLQARVLTRTSHAYALELAALYRTKDKKDFMMEEYLNYASVNSHGLSYVKNLFQSILQDEEDQDFLEEKLIERMQQYPSDLMYPDLLIWLEVQRKNFYAAFIQARAMDKRMDRPGDKSISIARLAMDNEDWDSAIEILEYIIKTYPEGRNYPTARTLNIRARENKVKTTFPVDTVSIRTLVSEYQRLYEELGSNSYSLEALRSKALLHAFYLGQLDSAIITLQRVINDRRAPQQLVSDCKLDLGDIYLLKDEPWESTLLYSQVEKANKSSPTGYEAKLRNAKLNYYTGNFALAKEHLDILKIATTKEISNDAIALSLLIQNNTVFDSTDHVMQEFADADLLVYQNKVNEAERKFKQMIDDYPRHSLIDEIYWELADLNMRLGKFESTISYLDQIINNYAYDVLADDAYYQKIKLLIEHPELSNDPEETMNILLSFLKDYPGSQYVAHVRKMIRQLRGDQIN